jgi:hypothetical protein
MSWSRPFSAVLLAAALLTAGCAPGGPPARPVDGRLAVVLGDFSIAPQDVSAPTGRLRLAVSNRGRLGHNLVLRRGERDLASMPTLKPGASGELVLRLPRPGEYRLVCSLGNHEELGQYATIQAR